MDLDKAAPIIEKLLRDVLEEKRYPFGFANYRGLGNKVASGKLRDSIKVVTMQTQGMTVLQVIAEEYFQWVQSGRLPGKKGVPIGSLEQWIKARGLRGRNKKGQFITKRSFAFAIQNNIKKFGIRPANFLDTVIETLSSDKKILEIIGEEAFDELINSIEGI